MLKNVCINSSIDVNDDKKDNNRHIVSPSPISSGSSDNEEIAQRQQNANATVNANANITIDNINADNRLLSGVHLMVDAKIRGFDQAKLYDSNYGPIILDKIVRAVDMTAILPPITVKFPHAICELERTAKLLESENLMNTKTYDVVKNQILDRHNNTYGYSSFVMIAESHITFHAFPENSFFTFDCYSCKEFEPKIVQKVLNDFFPDATMTVNVVRRYIPH
jgi:S-adenosylmethionine/arginine decarboxylase-like enzyme